MKIEDYWALDAEVRAAVSKATPDQRLLAYIAATQNRPRRDGRGFNDDLIATEYVLYWAITGRYPSDPQDAEVTA